MNLASVKPPLRRKLIVPLLLVCLAAGVHSPARDAGAVSYAPGVMPQAAITDYFERFARAVRTGNAGELPLVAPDFAAPTAALADARKFYPRAVEQLGGPLDEIVIDGLQTSAEGVEARVTWRFGSRRVERWFRFDAAGRVVGADFMFDAKHAKFAAPRVTMPDRVELPFVLRGNLPFVEAELDGQRGLFFFDTGASRITLNERFFARSQVPGSIGVSRGANGEHPTKRAHVTRLRLGSMVAEDFECSLADMSTLQQGDQPALGLIGQ